LRKHYVSIEGPGTHEENVRAFLDRMMERRVLDEDEYGPLEGSIDGYVEAKHKAWEEMQPLLDQLDVWDIVEKIRKNGMEVSIALLKTGKMTRDQQYMLDIEQQALFEELKDRLRSLPPA
jgi:hypothetical protein